MYLLYPKMSVWMLVVVVDLTCVIYGVYGLCNRDEIRNTNFI